MTTTTTFVWDPVFDCLISELDGTGTVQAVYTNEPQHYGSVISQRRTGVSHWLHADALGSTRMLTTLLGATTDTYVYDAWGNAIAASGVTTNPFRWVGRYGYHSDAATGLVYIRARMYVTTTGRWASFDPLMLSEGLNLFVYASSSPLLSVDPSGAASVIYMPYHTGIHYGLWRRAYMEHNFKYTTSEATAGALKRVESLVQLQFNIASVRFDNPFWEDNGTDCCSCHDLSAVQIAKTTGKTSDRPDWAEWHIDNGKIPFLLATATDPCNPNGVGMVKVDDQPGTAYPKWYDLDFQQQWETCIICMDGHRAQNGGAGVGSDWKVYCCIQWGHTFRTVRRGGRTDVHIHRYMNTAVIGTVRDDGMTSSEYHRDVEDFSIKGLDVPCIPPSATMKAILESK